MARRRLLIALLAFTALGVAGASSAGAAINTHPKPLSRAHTGGSGMGGMTGSAMRGKAMAHAELIAARSKHYGTIVYDKDHFAMYTFSGDHGTTSTCYGSCASAWPPMLTKGSPRVVGLKASLLGTTKRRNGSLQVTYGGHPLYYWSGDTAHTIMCQHVKLHGGYWYVLKTNGSPNMAMGVGTMGAMSR